MTLLLKARLRLLGFAALSLILIFTLACINRPMKNAKPDPFIGSVISIPQSAERDVDMLFVIDNSGSMAGEQANLRQNFSALMTELRNMTGGLPNVHLGVTSTDLGTGMFQITYCEQQGGDAGGLMTGACANPTGGAPYIIDVEPQSCEITKEPTGNCSAHTCSQTHCAFESSTQFAVDAATGCPRCRNYQNEELEDVFACIADLGTMGCGFEQPLESMYKALDTGNAANTGFIRENAFLAILLITDEDDCSGSTPQLYDNTQTDINSTLGPLTSYRCFEFGISCDINSRTHQGTRQNCVPREDGAALLQPLSRYIQFLQALKDPAMLVIAAIAGPVTPSPSGVGHNMVVGLDDLSQPDLQYSCTTAVDGAVPGIRVFTLISAFNEEADIAQWAYTSICSADYSPALQGIGNKIKDILEFQCLPSPLKGCADVGVEFGTPRADETCAVNAQCLAECQVTDVFERGTPNETEYIVPPCLEVMADGTLSAGNQDRTLAYANGHPNERDAALPVATCWHINYQENCPGSNYAEIIISRKNDPPPRSFTDVACKQISKDEQLCNDFVDNDEDCRVDMDDPCCSNPASCEN
ncbi:MAG: vWA domain-containing protein [bacterium]